MQYGLAFRYILDRPGGFVNLLLLTVCMFIPVVGPIVLLGYRAEVSVRLLHDPDLRRHPKFDFNRFVEYLTRGVWPFLIALILMFIAMIPAMLSVLLGLALATAVDPVAGLVVGCVGYLLSIIVTQMLFVPMQLHTEIAGRFDFGGAYRFGLQFWKTVGGPAILAGIVFTLLSTGVLLVGLLCCFIGIYLASALCQMAGQHILVQLYREYLARGGEPVPEYDPDEWRARRRYDDEYEEDEFEDDEYEDGH